MKRTKKTWPKSLEILDLYQEPHYSCWFVIEELKYIFIRNLLENGISYKNWSIKDDFDFFIITSNS